MELFKFSKVEKIIGIGCLAFLAIAGIAMLVIRGTEKNQGDKTEILETQVIVLTAKENLTSTGEIQELINPGTCKFGTFTYKVNESEWSEQIPSASEINVYNISWYIKGDSTHYDYGSIEQPYELVAEIK